MNRIASDDSFDRNDNSFHPRRRPQRKGIRGKSLSSVEREERVYSQIMAAPSLPSDFFSSLFTAKHLRPL